MAWLFHFLLAFFLRRMFRVHTEVLLARSVPHRGEARTAARLSLLRAGWMLDVINVLNLLNGRDTLGVFLLTGIWSLAFETCS